MSHFVPLYYGMSYFQTKVHQLAVLRKSDLLSLRYHNVYSCLTYHPNRIFCLIVYNKENIVPCFLFSTLKWIYGYKRYLVTSRHWHFEQSSFRIKIKPNGHKEIFQAAKFILCYFLPKMPRKKKGNLEYKSTVISFSLMFMTSFFLQTMLSLLLK